MLADCNSSNDLSFPLECVVIKKIRVSRAAESMQGASHVIVVCCVHSTGTHVS